MREHTAGLELKMDADAGFEDQELDFSDHTQDQQVDTQGTGEEDQPSVNPAWSELLEQVPQGFHELITPHLKKWDQGVQEQFRERAERERQYQEQLKQFEPYNELIQGTPPEQIKAARVLLDQLAADPKAFYERLGEHYGFTGQQMKQVMDNAQQAREDDEEDYGQQVVEDPRLLTLEQQQQQIVQYMQQQEAERMRQAADSEIEQELNELNSMIEGGLSPIDKREVLQRAILMGQTNPNVRLIDAWNDWQNVQRQMFENTPDKTAPRVVSSGGSANPVTPAKKPSEMSDEEFMNDTVQALKNLGR